MPPFDHRCVINLAKSYFGVPPPPPPAREINPHRKPQYLLHARPEVVLEKSKRLGKVALAHYNRRKMVKFELLDVMPVAQMPESGRLYTHINFTARSSKEVGHKGFQLEDGATVVRKNIDFSCCFACSSRMLHPRGDKYIAGQCNVAYIYTNTC